MVYYRHAVSATKFPDGYELSDSDSERRQELEDSPFRSIATSAFTLIYTWSEVVERIYLFLFSETRLRLHFWPLRRFSAYTPVQVMSQNREGGYNHYKPMATDYNVHFSGIKSNYIKIISPQSVVMIIIPFPILRQFTVLWNRGDRGALQ